MLLGEFADWLTNVRSIVVFFGLISIQLIYYSYSQWKKYVENRGESFILLFLLYTFVLNLNIFCILVCGYVKQWRVSAFKLSLVVAWNPNTPYKCKHFANTNTRDVVGGSGNIKQIGKTPANTSFLQGYNPNDKMWALPFSLGLLVSLVPSFEESLVENTSVDVGRFSVVFSEAPNSSFREISVPGRPKITWDFRI